MVTIGKRRPSLFEAFGVGALGNMIGRNKQMSEILDRIKLHKPFAKKSVGYYFQASPGVGKTLLLSHLYEKHFPPGYEDKKDQIFFLAADFNSGACDGALASKNYIIQDPQLFVLLRIYYVEFVNQKNLDWTNFLGQFFQNVPQMQYTQATNIMLDKLTAKAKGKTIVLLVDEIMKTEIVDGHQFSATCRSFLCQLSTKFCHYVIFSSLSIDFMVNLTPSGASMVSMINLPLLTYEETKSLIRPKINCKFVESEGTDKTPIEENIQEWCIERLATLSGGHGRSIDYLVQECDNESVNFTTLIRNAAEKLVPHMTNYSPILYAVLLAEKVTRSDFIGSETYDSLVSKGAFIDSLTGMNVAYIPWCPELFLHSYIDNCLNVNENVKTYLSKLLNMHQRFQRKEFETLHTYWEIMMRFVRTDKYSKMSLGEVYHFPPQRSDSDNKIIDDSFYRGYIVDAKSDLTLLPYDDGATLSVTLNTIIKPKSETNAGWDRLIFYECFPNFSKKKTKKRYVLPVFIQNKFSKEDATTKLDIGTVNESFNHCNDFLSTFCDFGYLTPISTEVHNQFVLIMNVRQKTNNNTLTNAPSNVIIYTNEHMTLLYGPTIGGFVKDLMPDTNLETKFETEH